MRPTAVAGHFAFISPFLSKPEATFTRAPDREVVPQIDLGGQIATTSFASVATSANLGDDHPDRALLNQIEPALLYVDRVAAGDPIPRELIDGRRSWEPDPDITARAVAAILAMIRATVGEGRSLDTGAAAEAVARRLVGVDTTKNAHIVDLIRESLDAAAYAMHLRACVTDCQRMVGEIATLATNKTAIPRKGDLREAAIKLRNVMVWASKRAMALDMAVNDIKSTVANANRLADQIWPAVNELRAWSVDIAPVFGDWAKIALHPKTARATDIEAFHRLVTIRYAEFDSTLYRPRPTGRMAAPQCRRGTFT